MTSSKRPHPPTETIRYVCMPGHSFTGSTLLAFLLNTNSSCASIGAAAGPISGVDFEDYPCSCGVSFRECEFWRRIESRVQETDPSFRIDTTTWNTRYTLTRSKLVNALATRPSPVPPVGRLRDAAVDRLFSRRLAQVGELNRALASAVLELTGAEVFVDSSRDPTRPRHLSRVPGLDVRVLHLVRDVRGNAVSVMKNYGVRDAAAAARQWRRSNLSAQETQRYVSPERWMTVHYSDLCSDLQGTMDGITAFLGVPAEPVPENFRATNHHIIGNRMRLSGSGDVKEDLSWQHQLSPEELVDISRVAGRLNRQFGFDWP